MPSHQIHFLATFRIIATIITTLIRASSSNNGANADSKTSYAYADSDLSFASLEPNVGLIPSILWVWLIRPFNKERRTLLLELIAIANQA